MVSYTPVAGASSRGSGSKTQEGLWISILPSSYRLECGCDDRSFSSQMDHEDKDILQGWYNEKLENVLIANVTEDALPAQNA